MKNFLIIIILLISFLQGCYYDDKEFLDPNRSICDTSIVTYSGSVLPVITAYCLGCHSGANAPLGIRMDTHAQLQSLASSGKLLGTVTHSPGFIPMPKNGTKLSDCNIAKIRRWVAEGAQNN